MLNLLAIHFKAIVVGACRLCSIHSPRRIPSGKERGVYAASTFANPPGKGFAIAGKTLKRPEGRAPGSVNLSLALPRPAKNNKKR
jgi:hypothetical protein